MGKVLLKNLKMYAWMVSKNFFRRFLSEKIRCDSVR